MSDFVKYVNLVDSKNKIFEDVKRVSPQEAIDGKLFGPMYHGTLKGKEEIIQRGFNVKYSVPYNIGPAKVAGPMGFKYTRYDIPQGTSNGYPLAEYYAGISAPVHHLGFGVYFTTTKSIAKTFAGNSTKGVIEFWLDAPDILEINFGAPRTMMNWWISNGYDMTAEETKNGDFRAWIRATGRLTRNLRKYGAVHFLGKSARGRLLDGDQVCVYDVSKLVVVDKKLVSGMEIGAKVVHTGSDAYIGSRKNELYVDDIKETDTYGLVGWKGVFWAHRDGEDLPRDKAFPIHLIPPTGLVGEIVNVRPGPNGRMFDVKWSKGGVRYNYKEGELIVAPARITKK